MTVIRPVIRIVLLVILVKPYKKIFSLESITQYGEAKWKVEHFCIESLHQLSLLFVMVAVNNNRNSFKELFYNV